MRKLTVKIPSKRQKLLRLKEEMESCAVCGSFGPEYEDAIGHLNYDRKVFGRGNPDAKVMIVGEGPGEEEEAKLKPFVGRSGRFLNSAIEAVGYTPNRDVYITNVVLCRPPNNRDPSKTEFNACKSRLAKQIVIVKPQVLVTLGNVPTKMMTKTSFGITTIHGQASETNFCGLKITFIPLYHPSYVLRRGGENSREYEEFLHDLGTAFATVD